MMRRAVLCDGTCPWQAGTARICEAYLAAVEGGRSMSSTAGLSFSRRPIKGRGFDGTSVGGRYSIPVKA